MLKDKKNIVLIVIMVIICGIIFFFQTKKVGLHEDEGYTIASSVNPNNGLMIAYDESNELHVPQWLSREYVTNYVTLSPENYLNLKSVYVNQQYDNHPPIFYALVHFSSILFGGQFSTYTVFVVNIIGFVLSCLVLIEIFKLLDKENLTPAALIFYGLSMGVISMVIFQRMYMWLTFFVLLYFYYSLKIYKNDFDFKKKDIIKLGFITVLGFLTQYFFAIYIIFIFLLMIIEMFRQKKGIKLVAKYTICHIVYAGLGILLFTPCINHLLYSDRGISNLGNADYFVHFYDYLKHLAYAFSVNTNPFVICIVLLAFFAGLIYLFKKEKNNRFVLLLTTIPGIIFFIITVKLTSFQELRYIMPMLPFVCINLLLILDGILNVKCKKYIIVATSIVLVLIGFVFSKPKFLYEDYEDYLEIAEQNKDKSFVYVYDNIFNHMQSIPEMMIYQKTLVINVNNGDMKYLVSDSNLNNEDSYILCIKSYMNNDDILNEIKSATDFKNITELHKVDDSSSEMISNNMYLVSK